MVEPASLTIAGASVAATFVALEETVKLALESATDQLKAKVKRWTTQRQMKRVARNLVALRSVKTIWQAERSVDLNKFYYPTKIQGTKTNHVASRVADLGADHVLIQGVVGQGKSIFLRYLASTELHQSKRVPLFCELRKMRGKKRLHDLLMAELSNLGVTEVDDAVLRWLLESGRVVLMLDAFDEVPEEQKAGVAESIEDLTRQFDQLQVIVTSRPGSGIENCPPLRVLKLAPLRDSEYEQVIARMMDSEESALAVIRGVREAGPRMQTLLATPLMVALLVVRFRIEQSLPENYASFFDLLFPLLLNRHDRLKAGYRRARASGLNDTSLLRVFNAFSFLSRKNDIDDASLSAFQRLMREGAQAANVTVDGDAALDDIIKITCLVLEEGGECKFVHRSVQEFHAASFVAESPEDHARRFYERMAARWRGWDQELVFLQQIDSYRFLKYFAVPDLRRALRLDAAARPADWAFSDAWMLETFLRDFVGYHVPPFSDDDDRAPAKRAILTCLRYHEHDPVTDSRSSRALVGKWPLKPLIDSPDHRVELKTSVDHAVKHQRRDRGEALPLADVAAHPTLGPPLRASAKRIGEQMVADLERAEAQIAAVERRDSLFEV